MRYILFVIFLLVGFHTYAQTSSSVTVLEGTPNKSRAKLIRVLGVVGEKSFALFQNGSHYEIHRFNKYLQVEAEYKIKLKLKGSELKFQVATIYGDEIVIFTSFKNRKHEVFYYIMQRLNAHTFDTSAEPIVVSSLPYQNNKSYPEIFVRKSDNSKHLAFIHRLITKEGVGDSIYIQLLDSNLHLSTYHRLSFGDKNSDPTIWDMKMSDYGTLFIVGGHSLYRKRLGLNQKRSITFLYACSASHLKKQEVDFQQRKIYDVAIQTHHDELISSYITSEKKGGVLSVLTFAYRADLSVSWQNHFFVDVDEILKSNTYDKIPLSLKKKSKHNSELHYAIRSFKMVDDTLIQLSLEQRYAYSVSDHPDAVEYYSSSFRYTHMMSIQMNRRGALKKISLIPKCQFGTSRYYFSFVSVANSHQTYFIYNDGVRNLNRKDDVRKCFDGGKRSVAMIAEISNDTIQKNPLVRLRSLGWLMVVDRSYYDERSNALYIYLRKKNSGKLIKVML